MQGADHEVVLSYLPPRLRTDLIVQMLETKFGVVPVFGKFGEAFVRALAPHFQRMVFIPDDVIVEVMPCCLLILSGKLLCRVLDV